MRKALGGGGFSSSDSSSGSNESGSSSPSTSSSPSPTNQRDIVERKKDEIYDRGGDGGGDSDPTNTDTVTDPRPESRPNEDPQDGSSSSGSPSGSSGGNNGDGGGQTTGSADGPSDGRGREAPDFSSPGTGDAGTREAGGEQSQPAGQDVVVSENPGDMRNAISPETLDQIDRTTMSDISARDLRVVDGSLQLTNDARQDIAGVQQDLRAGANAATSGAGELSRGVDATDFTTYQDEVDQIAQQVEEQNPGADAGEDFTVGIDQSGEFTVSPTEDVATQAESGNSGTSESATDSTGGQSGGGAADSGAGTGGGLLDEAGNLAGDAVDAVDEHADQLAGQTDEWVGNADVDDNIADAATSGGLSRLPLPTVDLKQQAQVYNNLAESRNLLGFETTSAVLPGVGTVPVGVRAGLSEETSSDTAADQYTEGAVSAFNPAAALQGVEDLAEVADNPAVYARNPSETVESTVGFTRETGEKTVEYASENPYGFAGGVTVGLAGTAAGGVTALRGSGSVTRALAAEVDPRVGPLGTTLETSLARRARDRLSNIPTPDDERGSLQLGKFGQSDTGGSTGSESVTLDESTIADETATADIDGGQRVIPPEGVSGVERDPVKQGLNEQGAFVGSNTRSQDPAFGGTGKPDRRPDRDFSDALSGGGVVDRDTDTASDIQLATSVEAGAGAGAFGMNALAQASTPEVSPEDVSPDRRQVEQPLVDPVGVPSGLLDVDGVGEGLVGEELVSGVDQPAGTRVDQPANTRVDQPVEADVRQPQRVDQPGDTRVDQPVDTRVDQPAQPKVDLPVEADQRAEPNRDWPFDADQRNRDRDADRDVDPTRRNSDFWSEDEEEYPFLEEEPESKGYGWNWSNPVASAQEALDQTLEGVDEFMDDLDRI